MGSLQFSDACLRTYAHPELLKVAEAINGEDFAPFNEALFIKEPGVGAAVLASRWCYYWGSEDFDEDICYLILWFKRMEVLLLMEFGHARNT